MRFMMISILLTSLGWQAQAEIRTERVEYKDGDTILEGYVAYDDKLAAKRPGILVVHDWLGVGPQVKQTIERLAALGYTAFAADIYGKGIRPTVQEAATVSGTYKSNRALMRSRAQAGLQALAKQKTVDAKRLAVIGYCFGGTTALELGRSGADLRGIVSFHGGLDTPEPKDAKNIKGKVLVLHGADDPFVPPAQVAEFEKEMRAGKVDWKLVSYPGAVHAFTNPGAGSDKAKGAAYNTEADKLSWQAMANFLKEIF